MKKVLIILGAIFLVLILVVVAVIGYAAYTGNKLDASSRAYVDESVPAIISTWSKDELIKRASPQLRQKTSDDQIDQLFTTLSSKLGTFQSYDGAKGQSNMSFTSQDGQVTTASYVAGATFQNGKAEIQIKLIRDNDSWQILGFHVELKPL
jgi:hypothetical protein